MLRELSLRNYLLLEDLHLEFSPGFNVITGETGSGKSVLLEGIRILLGESISKDDIRNADEKAYFELIYEDEDSLISLTREIFPSGRSISRINGEIVNLKTVRETFGPIIDFYGQRDDSLLLHKSNQEKLLFDYAGENILPVLKALESEKKGYDGLTRELQELKKLSGLEKEALLSQLRELSQLDIDLEEDQALEASFDEILHSKEILRGLDDSLELIDGGILSKLYQLEDIISGLNHYSRQEELVARLKSLGYELEDIRELVRDSLYSLDIDENLILAKERRFIELSDVKKKYQRDLFQLLDYKGDIEKTLDIDARQDEIRKSLEEKRAGFLKAYKASSKELVSLAEIAFEKMAEELKEVLRSLELADSEFGLELEKRDQGQLHPQGYYRMGFLASMNKGPLRPMAKILSGGEMSRLMLALKSISKSREVMIFDEIDTGISGKVAHQVARQIKRLSKNRQIIAISHLAQVVAFSDKHFHLEKDQGSTRAIELGETQHQEMLATMMSGQLNKSSFETAGKMIERARGEKI